jgi:mannose-1-phosphate guanylyltransferase
VDPFWDETRAERGDGEFRLEQDILAPLSQSKKLYVYETKDFWRQIKSAGYYLQDCPSKLICRSAVPANALYLQQSLQSSGETPLTPLTPPSVEGPEIVPPVYIHPSATVHPTAKIGPNVSISADARIGPGARIKNSIILSGAEIAPHAVVLHSIVAWDCKVGAWARVEGTPLAVHEHGGKVVRGGVKVDAATILGREVIVGEGVVVRNCVVLPNKGINNDVCNEVCLFPFVTKMI